MFDAEAYWKGKEHKKWVVTTMNGPIYVGSRTKEGAMKTARRHAKRGYLQARLATPRDLGCTSPNNR